MSEQAVGFAGIQTVPTTDLCKGEAEVGSVISRSSSSKSLADTSQSSPHSQEVDCSDIRFFFLKSPDFQVTVTRYAPRTTAGSK